MELLATPAIRRPTKPWARTQSVMLMPAPTVRNATDDEHRLPPVAKVLAVTVSARHSPDAIRPMIRGHRPLTDAAPSNLHHPAPSGRSPERCCPSQPRRMPPAARRTAPAAPSTRGPCGCPRTGGVCPSVSPSVWGSLLPPLLSGV